MDKQEKIDLINKIFDVKNNPKTARLSLSRFVQRADSKDGEQFLEYLKSKDDIKKKIARNIVGQLSVTDALEILIPEFLESTESLTFLPDLEYKERMFYKNLVEILESIFLIIANEKEKADHSSFLFKLEEIFKKTKNDDLRFSLIKLIAFLGNRINHFIKIYSALGDKEKRALFYVYTLKEEEGRMLIYQKGYEEKSNFEFLLLNLLKFQAGREFLNKQLPQANDREKELILKKISDTKSKEFNETLIELLKSENKFIITLAKDILLRTLEGSFEPERFINLLKTGYSNDLVKTCLEIVGKFISTGIENILFDAFQTQTIHVNKNEILNFMISNFKLQKKLSLECSNKLVPVISQYFETYKSENDEMLVSIMKLYTILKYEHSIQVKKIKTRILRFVKQYDKSLALVVKNKANESINGLNKIINRLEQNENKIKTVLNLMEIEPGKIDSNRLTTFKNELDQLKIIDRESLDKINVFLLKIYEHSPNNWKKRAESAKIFAKYGNRESLPRLIEIEQNEKSFGVNIALKESIEVLKEKFEEHNSVLILTPLFYINKLISTFFEKISYKIDSIKEIDQLSRFSQKHYNYIFLSDSYHDIIDFALLRKMTEQKGGLVIIVISNQDPQKIYEKFGRANITLLNKPYNDQNIQLAANL
jgi:hypothetical protein